VLVLGSYVTLRGRKRGREGKGLVLHETISYGASVAEILPAAASAIVVLLLLLLMYRD